MDREQIRARQTTIEAHVYSTSGKQGLWDALEHNAWMRNDISDLLAAIDDLEAENKKLKLDLAAAEHYTTDDLTSPARLCVKCRRPWPCEFTSVPAQGYGRTGGGPAFQSWLDESFEKSHGRLLDDTFPA